MAEATNENEEDLRDSAEALCSRRALLKMVAGAPLLATFGLSASPLMRYLKPTMQPGGFFQASDQPDALEPFKLNRSYFPEIWTCIPFGLDIKYLEFNSEQYQTRKVWAFAIRLPTDRIVAFSRICPKEGCQYVNFIPAPADIACGCSPDPASCCCRFDWKAPVLMCPCDFSVFDVADEGRVLRGPAPRPVRKLVVEDDGKWITISQIEPGGIV